MIVWATAGTGVIEGGWEYVIAAYAVTWLFFVGYAAYLWVRKDSAHGEVR